ncbi:hypothetical protein D9M68_997530 [compost metagenome]
MSEGEKGNAMFPSRHMRPGKSECSKVTRASDSTALATSCVLATTSAMSDTSSGMTPAAGSQVPITPAFPYTRSTSW